MPNPKSARGRKHKITSSLSHISALIWVVKQQTYNSFFKKGIINYSFLFVYNYIFLFNKTTDNESQKVNHLIQKTYAVAKSVPDRWYQYFWAVFQKTWALMIWVTLGSVDYFLAQNTSTLFTEVACCWFLILFIIIIQIIMTRIWLKILIFQQSCCLWFIDISRILNSLSYRLLKFHEP